MTQNYRALSSEERILVHLLPYHSYVNDMAVPFEITQKGIADAIGVKLTHISRLLSALSEKGLVEFRKAHVQGMQKKVKVYFLTSDGMERAEKIMAGLEGMRFPVMLGGERSERKYSEIKEMTGATILQIIDILESDGVLDISSMKPARVGIFLMHHPPSLDGFVGRKKEINEVSELIKGDSTGVVIYGNPGYGKSTLLSMVMKGFSKDINMLWITINRRTTLDDILRPISSFLTSLDRMGLESLMFGGAPQDEIVSAIASRLKDTHSVLVFDGYGEVREELVEFFISLLKAISGSSGIKMVFTAQADTPYYCRFYGPKDVENGTVAEYHLSGLSYEDTGRFLGIEDGENLKRIHRMTSGNPSLLKLIKEGNTEELKASGRFSTEEANMLIYLAGH